MHGIRNYDGLMYCDYVENEYIMSVLHVAGIRRGRSQHAKQEWDNRYHEPTIRRQDLEVLLKLHPGVNRKLRAWMAGCKDADVLGKKMGLKEGISNVDWNDPWTATAEKLHVAEEGSNSSSEESDADEGSESLPEESDADDDIILDPFAAPEEQTFGEIDLRIVCIQLCTKEVLARMTRSNWDSQARFTVCLHLIQEYCFAVRRADREIVNKLVSRLTTPLPRSSQVTQITHAQIIHARVTHAHITPDTSRTHTSHTHPSHTHTSHTHKSCTHT